MLNKHRALILGVMAITLAAVMAAFSLSRKHDPLELRVDLSERELVVIHDGVVEHRYDVAVGKAGHRTPAGRFQIDRIIWNPAWVPPDSEWAEGAERQAPGDPDNPMQGAKLFFRYPAYYIHGTNAPESLGEAASHGCIRMAEDDVERLARVVQEHGGEGRTDAWYREVISSKSDLREIVLNDPVRLIVES